MSPRRLRRQSSRVWRVLTAIALVATATCAKSPLDLTPFPCAADGDCPRGLACIPGVGCAPARVDAPCNAATSCSTAAEGASCVLGVCVAPCDEKLICPAGRICSSAAGPGGCVTDCTTSGRCPAGLACRALGSAGKKGCLGGTATSPIGGPCTGDGVCAAAGASARCSAGVCALPCSADGTCGAGEACSRPKGRAGFCHPDCSRGETCIAGLVCKEAWFEGRRVCMGTTDALPACQSVEVAEKCAHVCGTFLADFAECSSTIACPAYTSCATATTCGDCWAGSTLTTCDGKPCTGASCPPGKWFCEPNNLALDCSTPPNPLLARCLCADGTTRTSPCGSNQTCEARCQDSCPLVGGACPDPANPKCTLTLSADGKSGDTRCMPLKGTKAEGETCARANSAPSSLGDDDCAAGLLCWPRSLAAGDHTCRRFCDTDADCPGARCAYMSGDFNARLCSPTCKLFQPGCPTGTDCKFHPGPTDVYGVCGFTGTSDEGGPCRYESDCKGNLNCLLNGVCVAPCDPSHPCTAGKCSNNAGPVGAAETGFCAVP